MYSNKKLFFLFFSTLGIFFLQPKSFFYSRNVNGDALGAEVLNLGSPKRSFGSLELNGVEVFKSKDKSEDLRLSKTNFNRDKNNILYLDFTQTLEPHELKDLTGNYKTTKSNYYSYAEAESQIKYAYFNHPTHGVWLEALRVPKSIFFGNQFQNDFTIELRFRPDFFQTRTVLFKKSFYARSKARGLEIFIENKKLKVHFKNLFEDTYGVLHSITLTSRKPLQVKDWTHLYFSFQASQGKLALYINGHEEEVVFAKETGTVWALSFDKLDRSPIFLASQFIGAIDFFRIVSQKLEVEQIEKKYQNLYSPVMIDYDRVRVEQPRGIVISEVLSVSQKDKIELGNFQYASEEKVGTALDVFVRASLNPFEKDDAKFPVWERVQQNGGSKLKNFRFFQWKASLRADSLGKHTPVLRNIKLIYVKSETLLAPYELRLARLHNEQAHTLKIELEWKHDLYQNKNKQDTGFCIYYGLKPGEYLGHLKSYKTSMSSSSQINANTTYTKFLGFIDNETVATNRMQNPKAMLPILEAGKSYYFSIKYYNEVLESPFSNEILVIIPEVP